MLKVCYHIVSLWQEILVCIHRVFSQLLKNMHFSSIGNAKERLKQMKMEKIWQRLDSLSIGKADNKNINEGLIFYHLL